MTPYHVFLSTMIALEQREVAESRMLLIEYFYDANAIRKALCQWITGPFVDVRSLETAPPWLSKLVARLVRDGTAKSVGYLLPARRNIAAIESYVRRHCPGRVYVYNDWLDLSQGAMYYAKRENPECQAIYVEDGFAPYFHNLKSRESWKRAIFRKLFIGNSHWFRPVRLLGTSHLVDECMVSFPELRVPELQKYPCKGISAEPIQDPDFIRWADDYLETCGIPKNVLEQIGCIFVPPQARGWEDRSEWQSYLKLVRSELDKHGSKVAIKYHPREWEKDYLGVENLPGIVVLPRQVSMEYIYARALGRLRYVIGDVSTSMITAKWLSPDLKVIACSATTGHRLLSSAFSVLDRLGCEIVNSEEELRAALR